MFAPRRLRISLGLKPLRVDGSGTSEEELARQRHRDQEKKKEQDARAKAVLARQAE
jgi:hypothetical protein